IGDGEVLDRRGQLGRLHLHADKFVALVLVRNAPLASLLVDNQGPLAGSRHGEDGVAARGHGFAANYHIGTGNESCGFISPGAPNFAEGHEFPVDLAAFHARAGVVGLDGFSAAQIARSRGWWTGLASAHLSEDGCSEQDKQCGKGNSFLHGFSLLSTSQWTTTLDASEADS